MRKDLKKDINRTITRVAKAKKGTGRTYTKAEINHILHKYRRRTAGVKANMDWEDYLNLIDIATYVNSNNAVDLSYRLGYIAGREEAKDKVSTYFAKEVR